MKHKFLRILSVGTIIALSSLSLAGCSKGDNTGTDNHGIVVPDKINLAIETIVNDTTTDVIIESNAKDKELTVSYLDKDGKVHSNELVFTNGKTTVLFPRLQEDYTIHDLYIYKGEEKLFYRANLIIYKMDVVAPEPTPDSETKTYSSAILTDELCDAAINFMINNEVKTPSKISVIEDGKEILNDKSLKYYTFDNDILTINKLAFGFGTHKLVIYYTFDKTTKFLELDFETKSEDFISNPDLVTVTNPVKGVSKLDLIFSIKLKENVHLKSFYINNSLYELVEGTLDSKTGLTKYYIKVNAKSNDASENFEVRNIRFEYNDYIFEVENPGVNYSINYKNPSFKVDLKYNKTDYYDDENKIVDLSIENNDSVTIDSILINNTWYNIDVANPNNNIETQIELYPNSDGKDIISSIKYRIEDTELEIAINKEFSYNILKKYKITKINEGRYKNGSYYYSSVEGTRFYIEFDETLDSNVTFEFSGTYGDSSTFKNGVINDGTTDTIFACGIEGNKIYFDFSNVEPADIGEYLSLRFNKFNIIRADKNASYSILNDLNYGNVSIKKAGFFEGISYVRIDTDRNVIFFRANSGYDLSKLMLNKLTVELYDENQNLISIPNNELDVSK